MTSITRTLVALAVTAVAGCATADEARPNEARSLTEAGNTYFARGDYRRALAAYIEACDADRGRDPALHLKVAVAAHEANRPDIGLRAIHVLELTGNGPDRRPEIRRLADRLHTQYATMASSSD